MNRKQKFCLWIGIAVIVLMGIFPPVQRTTRTFEIYGNGETYETIGYGFILATGGGIVVFSNLLVQWIVVSIITGGLIYAFRDKKPQDEQTQLSKSGNR